MSARVQRKARFKRVAVLMGGPSAERDVSLRSGTAVGAGLREAGYEVTPVVVADTALAIPAGVEAVFIALHGEFGEDGEVQERLAAMGIPYTGSGPAASRAAFDKKACKAILAARGIPTPAYEIVRSGQTPALGLPAVVKPTRQGSSLGVSRVSSASQWPAALRKALRYGDEALVELFVAGSELTAGIVGQEALPIVEIRAPRGWYDYRAKYTKGLTTYLVPAPVSEESARACQAFALRTFEVLGCRGMARVDFRLSKDGTPFVLELNSIPGFTETSLLPKAAAAAGIGFSELCARIMEDARVS